MPDILPISVPAPAAPAATAPVAGVAPAAAAPGDAAPADFMGQLAAALKGLKTIAAAVKGVPTPQTPEPADATPLQATDTPDGAAKPVVPTDDVTELMASLGLMMLPQPQAPTLHPQAVAATAAAPVAAQQAPAALPQAAQPSTAKPGPDADAAQELAAKLPQTPVSPDIAKHVAEHLPEPKAAPVAESKTERTDEPQATIASDTQLVVQHSPAPQAATPAVTPNVQSQLQAETGAFQQPSGGGQHRHAENKSTPVAESTAARAETSPQPAFVDAPLTPSAPVDSAALAAPQSAQVAGQIAQQVDLYRLPGSKGVRIQLHPEDLGGVQVTLRYGNGGNLELHVNVEHAATGALVQDGLNHLRDALATHGFEPDRIVMSVTAPSGASQMDFNSNGNGSYRSDPGMTAFSQDGQSSQQGSQQENARGSRGWSSNSDSDDSPRADSQTSSGTSVIDYRV